MEKKLTPALLDEKDVTTDWIEDVFDQWAYAECHNRPCAVGFVNDCPVFVTWQSNYIVWRIIENNINNYEETLDVIRERLAAYESPDNGIFSTVESWGCNSLMQKFYFNDND